MTNTDLIGIFSIMIALQGLFVVYYKTTINRSEKKRKNALKQANKNTMLLKSSHQILITTLSEISSMQRFHNSLIIRIGDKTRTPALKKISSEMNLYNISIDKSISELNLFSTNPTVRQMAIQQLVEEYGDSNSRELMRNCNEIIYNGKNIDLQSGIQKLDQRIEYNLNHHR